jgi:hypothetical protein
MDMHPTLTSAVYAIIIIVLLSVMTYTILYTRGLKVGQATLDEKGRLPLDIEEGIAVATLHKEHTGRTGTISYRP